MLVSVTDKAVLGVVISKVASISNAYTYFREKIQDSECRENIYLTFISKKK
jgi:hypothetical protein